MANAHPFPTHLIFMATHLISKIAMNHIPAGDNVPFDFSTNGHSDKENHREDNLPSPPWKVKLNQS